MPLDPTPSRISKWTITNLPVVVLAIMAAGAVVFPIALAIGAITGIFAA